METLKIGVIGTGHMGTNHIRNISDEKRFEFVGIYDLDYEHASSLAAQYGTRAYRSMEDLLKEITAVVIAVPSSLHKEVGLKAAEYGVHALIEKPLATNSKDAEILINAFEDAGLKLQVGHIERFNAVVQETKKLLDGEKVFYIEAHRYSAFSGSGRIKDVSVIEDLMIHDIDLVCDFMEPATVTDIRGNGESVRSDNVDFATCMLEFSTNSHAVINASRVSQSKARTIEIHTADSVIVADLLNKTLTVTRGTEIMVGNDPSKAYKQDAIVQKIFVPIIEPLRAELKSFYEAVVTGEDVLVDGKVALRAIRICEKTFERSTHERA